MQDILNPVTAASAGLVARPLASDFLNPVGIFTAECFDAKGRLKWVDEFHNLVTTQGKNAMLDKFLGLGAAYALIGMGLHTTVGSATSTYAAPTPQVEATVIAARLAPSFSAASAGSKATSAVVGFAITGTATITGCFIVLGATGVLTLSDTATAAAVLLSSGAFSGGSRAVVSGDTFNRVF